MLAMTVGHERCLWIEMHFLLLGRLDSAASPVAASLVLPSPPAGWDSR